MGNREEAREVKLFHRGNQEDSAPTDPSKCPEKTERSDGLAHLGGRLKKTLLKKLDYI